jgi:hypothetical protein
MGGLGDVLEDAGKWVADNKDTLANIAEVAVTAIAPAAAPIVAAEHAIRTGKALDFGQAKAATTAATSVGKAVAATQGVTPDHDVIRDVAPPEVHAFATEQAAIQRATAELPDPDASAAKGKSSSGNTLLVVGLGLGLLWLMSRE